MSIKKLDDFFDLTDKYTHYIFDIWGVIHDGDKPYPFIKDYLHRLAVKEKHITLISNTPATQYQILDKLVQMGFDEACFNTILTAGDVAKTFINNHGNYKQLTHYFVIGNYQLNSIRHTAVTTLEQAEFIILADMPEQPVQELITNIANSALPILCINPDKITVTLANEINYEAGTFADVLIENNIAVDFIGKPHQAIYELAYEMSPTISKDKCIAIGDNIETDIAGANAFGITSILKLGGVSSQIHGKFLQSNFNDCPHGLRPDYVMN